MVGVSGGDDGTNCRPVNFRSGVDRPESESEQSESDDENDDGICSDFEIPNYLFNRSVVGAVMAVVLLKAIACEVLSVEENPGEEGCSS